MINDKRELNLRRAAKSSRNGGAVKVVAMLVGVSVAATGCTHFAAKRNNVNEALAEESRALTTAVVDSLQSQPASERDAYAVTALAFAKQDQRVEGLPLKPFDVPALLAGMGLTNNLPPLSGPPAVEVAREEVAKRFEKQDELLAKRAVVDSRLIERGEQFEEERNERIKRWTKFGVWGTTLIGGAVALFVFCPIALPICGRLLAWIVGKVPSLASAFGVVSVKAFDAVVRGIEKAKDQHATLERRDPGTARLQPRSPNQSPAAPTVPVANALLASSSGDSRRGQTTSWIDQLHNHLAREMDAAHKALVRARKTQLA